MHVAHGSLQMALEADTQDSLYLAPAQLGSPDSCETTPQAMSLRGHIVAVQDDHKLPLQPDGAPEDTACELSTTNAPPSG